MAAAQGTRAKDSDRNDTCQRLDTALADGELSGEEHAERIKAATNATTLSQLQGLITDLQPSGSTEKRPALSGSNRPWWRRWYLSAAIALLLTGVLIGWGAYGNTSSPLSFTSDPGAKPDGVAPIVLTPPRQLQSLGGLTGLLQQMHDKFGDTTGYELDIYSDYAYLVRTDPTEPRRSLRYRYQGGFDKPDEYPAGSNPRVVDLGKFDVKKIVGILRGAPETLGISPSEVKNINMEIKYSEDTTAPPDTVQIEIYVSGQFNKSGSIYLTPDGTPTRTNYPSGS